MPGAGGTVCAVWFGGKSVVFVALLRGINVGGHMVKMDRLRGLFDELGFTQVRTYIQSGNVFFETSDDDRAALTQTIERHLHNALGYMVPVFLRTIPELEDVVSSKPLNDESITPDMRLCVVFAANPIPTNLALPLWSPKHDIEIIQTRLREALVVWHLIDGRPPVSQDFLERSLGSKVTTRFFHTTAKILQAAKLG